MLACVVIKTDVRGISCRACRHLDFLFRGCQWSKAEIPVTCINGALASRNRICPGDFFRAAHWPLKISELPSFKLGQAGDLKFKLYSRWLVLLLCTLI